MVTALHNEIPLPDDFTGCPHLGLQSDQTTRFGYPNTENYCHCFETPESVSSFHQSTVCLTAGFYSCPVYLGEYEKGLPDEIRGYEDSQPFWNNPWVWGIASITFILILIAVLVWRNGGNQPGVSINLTQGVTVLVSETRPSSLAGASNSDTPTPTSFDTPDQVATSDEDDDALGTPTSSITAASTPSPSPGPAVETPFGLIKTYLVHKVNPGESLPSLTERFETSLEVIKKINQLGEDNVLWLDQILILMPGVIDVTDVEPLIPIFLDGTISLFEISSQFGVTEDEVRAYNELGAGDYIPEGRWLVLPWRDVIATFPVSPIRTPDLRRALTTPFGTEDFYVLHEVQPGDSVAFLENLYLTSAEVIQRINQIEGSIHENQILVIMLNQDDPSGLPFLKAMLIESQTSVEDLATQLYILPSVIYQFNGIEDGGIIPAGQWIIYPD